MAGAKGDAPTLNPAQAEAVAHSTGPLLVLAGAGSGKTRVITHRIANLVKKGVPAPSILALTFTNKAAGEMRERVARVLPRGASADKLTVSTFHSFGLGVLQKERAAHGGAFTIFDQGDTTSLLRELLRGVVSDMRYDVAAILARISNAKNAFLAADELPDHGNDDYDEIARELYPKYQAAMRQFRAYDFDDLVCEVVRLWQARGDVLARFQERHRFLLVDEYQDTNRAQFELLRLLGGTAKNVCVVGDDDQSIYAWRGADVRNILEFEAHFPGARVIKLEQNYRSTAPILAVANAVIGKRIDVKYKKTLFTAKAGGAKVEVVCAPTPEAEATYVARRITALLRDEQKKPSDIAVLYRSNGQAKLVEESLREERVTHRVFGGQQFFERKEVKDLLAYLKVALNPHDEVSLRRVINYPARGIGETSVERLATHALARGWSLFQAVERVGALEDIPAAAQKGCNALEQLVHATHRELAAEKLAPSAVARSLAERIGLKRDIEAASGSATAAGRRWANVEGLFRTFARREKRDGVQGTSGLAAFLHLLTLDFGDDEHDDGNFVTLSTLHGAKGLEFDVVFLVGCEEGILPHSRTLDTRVTDAVPQEVEEERRLFYVGVTRARERLCLLRSKARLLRGKLVSRTPSRFLLDIPKELVDEHEATGGPALGPAELKAQADAILAMLDGIGS